MTIVAEINEELTCMPRSQLKGYIKATHNKCSSWQIHSLYRLLRLTQNCHRFQMFAISEKHTDASKTFKVSFGPKLSLLLVRGSMLW